MDFVIEKLRADEFRKYIEKTGIFPQTILNERVDKLSICADFVTARSSEGELSGTIAFYMNVLPTCYITHVSVLKECRRQGILTSMYRVLEIEARLRQFALIRLEVEKKNVIAQKCYQNLGFVYENIQSDRSFFMRKALT